MKANKNAFDPVLKNEIDLFRQMVINFENSTSPAYTSQVQILVEVHNDSGWSGPNDGAKSAVPKNRDCYNAKNKSLLDHHAINWCYS
jgi:hypothetical protein